MWKNNFWSCPCFPSCSPPIHFPTIDRSWVAGWATSSQALVAQERLPRPAIRQITHTAPTPITLTCILPTYTPFPFSPRLSLLYWTRRPWLPNLTPNSFQFFVTQHISNPSHSYALTTTNLILKNHMVSFVALLMYHSMKDITAW